MKFLDLKNEKVEPRCYMDYLLLNGIREEEKKTFFERNGISSDDYNHVPSRFKIALPRSFTDDESCLQWYKLPYDVYEHKRYPTCPLCHDKFVPINKGDVECFKCCFQKK